MKYKPFCTLWICVALSASVFGQFDNRLGNGGDEYDYDYDHGGDYVDSPLNEHRILDLDEHLNLTDSDDTVPFSPNSTVLPPIPEPTPPTILDMVEDGFETGSGNGNLDPSFTDWSRSTNSQSDSSSNLEHETENPVKKPKIQKFHGKQSRPGSLPLRCPRVTGLEKFVMDYFEMSLAAFCYVTWFFLLLLILILLVLLCKQR